MKKFYTTLVLAAAVAFSASAADFQSKQLQGKELKQISSEMSVSRLEAGAIKMAAPTAMKVKPSKVQDILGYYMITYIDLYQQDVDNAVASLIFRAGDKENEVKITGFGPGNDTGSPVIGKFDPKDASLTIESNQYLMNSAQGRVYWQHVIVNENGSPVPTDEPLVCYFDDNGNLEVPGYNGYVQGWFNGFLGSQNLQGYAAGMIRSTKRIEAPQSEGWSDAGNATFSDGWFLAGFGCIGWETPVQFPALDVKVQRNKENPNLFRLMNPYAGVNAVVNGDIPPTSENYLDLNETLVDGCIEFDITDPACVLVTPQVYSGLDCPIWGMSLYYMGNGAGNYALVENEYTQDMTIQERVDVYKEIMQESGEPLSTFDSNSNTVIISDGEFNMSGYPEYVTWNAFADFVKEVDPDTFGGVPSKIDMTSVIMLPDLSGINNVIMDNTNSTLEYYNLQGVRVENPSNGIFIRRQGNDVQKVFVR